MFGYAPGEAVGRPIAALMPALAPRGRAPFADDVRARKPGIVGRTVELTGRRQSGEEFPLELSLSAVGAEGGEQFVGSIRDQTERQRMRAMLAQSEKLASIGLLSAGVAHEINNPLAYVANNLAVLERDLGGVAKLINVYESAHDAIRQVDPDVVTQALAVAEELDWPYVRDNLNRMFARTREGVQRVATIVGNLRWLARTSPTKMEDARASDLLESALEMVRVRLRRRHIQVEVEHGVGVLSCVPTQISQVLLNLLINACQAIETSSRPEGGLIRFRSFCDRDWNVLCVTDDGPGVPDDAMPRLFDPFFTTKSVGEGTGLGLSICHGIVHGHGGRIEVESAPGQGATFKVFLPRPPHERESFEGDDAAPADAARAATPHAPAPAEPEQ
jgi:PAS domain S-box-containing protein